MTHFAALLSVVLLAGCACLESHTETAQQCSAVYMNGMSTMICTPRTYTVCDVYE